MLPLETSNAGLTKTDFEILNFLEYPKTLEQIKRQFPNVNVAQKLLDLLDKEFIQESRMKYVSKFYTNNIKQIIDKSRVPDQVKKNFHFFLSQIDNPFVREAVYDGEIIRKIEYILDGMTKSIVKPLSKKETVRMRIFSQDLLDKLR